MTRVVGHGLQREGKPYNPASTPGVGPAGRGLCSCGALSERLATDAARKRWHKEHKQDAERAIAASDHDRQPREHPVPCQVCHRPTWELSADCGQHTTAGAP